MSAYFDRLCEAMTMLHERGAVFLGQAVAYSGTAMYQTMKHLSVESRIEMPVAEDMQMGICTGMALSGLLPVCVYPRWNFLLLATNQLVLHLDRLPTYSLGGYNPRVIIRTASATNQPMDPGVQHLGDFSMPYRTMLRNIRVVQVERPEEIMPAYQAAAERDGSTLIVEYLGLYND